MNLPRESEAQRSFPTDLTGILHACHPAALDGRKAVHISKISTCLGITGKVLSNLYATKAFKNLGLQRYPCCGYPHPGVWLVETYQQAEAVCHLCRDKGDTPPEQRKPLLQMLRKLLPQPHLTHPAHSHSGCSRTGV